MKSLNLLCLIILFLFPNLNLTAQTQITPMPMRYPSFSYTATGVSQCGPGNGIFTNPKTFPAQGGSYSMIVDSIGYPIFLRGPQGGGDFKSNDSLWLFSTNTWVDPISGLDSSFQCQSPNSNDGHDWMMLPNGNTLILCQYDTIMDLSSLMTYPNATIPIPVPGDTNAVVTYHRVLELDPNSNVIRLWDGASDISVGDTDPIFFQDPTKLRVMHVNSISMRNGILLVSSRLCHEATAIDWATGNVLWRMGGGSSNQFTFIGDSLNGFQGQHTIVWSGDSTITVYDNGLLRANPVMRAVEYRIDTTAMTATLIWDYTVPGYIANSQGGVQKLSNDNVLISWGKVDVYPYPNEEVLEVDASGQHVFSLEMGNFYTYRAFCGPVIVDRPEIMCDADSVWLISTGSASPDSLVEWNNGATGNAIAMDTSVDHLQAFIAFNAKGFLGSNVFKLTDCVPIGIDPVPTDFAFSIWPNPSERGEFNVRSMEQPKVYDMLGRQIHPEIRLISENEWHISLPKGMHLISNGKQHRKVISLR